MHCMHADIIFHISKFLLINLYRHLFNLVNCLELKLLILREVKTLMYVFILPEKFERRF